MKGIERKSDSNGNIYISKIVLEDRQKAINALGKYLDIIRPESTSGVDSPIFVVNPVSGDTYNALIAGHIASLPAPEVDNSNG